VSADTDPCHLPLRCFPVPLPALHPWSVFRPAARPCAPGNPSRRLRPCSRNVPLARSDPAAGYRFQTAFGNSSIDRTTRETVALVESSLPLWQTQRTARRIGTRDQPKIHFIRVDFQASQDPAERAFFDAVPTNLHRPGETTGPVDPGRRMAPARIARLPETAAGSGDRSGRARCLPPVDALA